MISTYESELEQSGKLIFTVNGVSMRPLFHAQTDAILIKKCSPEMLKNLDIVLFKRFGPKGEQYVLHRIVDKNSDGLFVIAGDNCADADYVRPEDILGVVVSAQRGNKPIKLDGFRYSWYLKTWCAPYKFRFKRLRFRWRLRSIAKRILFFWRK